MNPDDDVVDLWCKECQISHGFECPKLGPIVTVEDSKVQTRAVATLPSGLRIESIDGSRQVVAAQPIATRTLFGPLDGEMVCADSENSFTKYKIFADKKVQHCLDLTDEDKCNWMSLVTMSSDPERQNLASFQRKGQIFFLATRYIKQQEALCVWYLPSYEAKLNNKENFGCCHGDAQDDMKDPKAGEGENLSHFEGSSHQPQIKSGRTLPTYHPRKFRGISNKESVAEGERYLTTDNEHSDEDEPEHLDGVDTESEDDSSSCTRERSMTTSSCNVKNSRESLANRKVSTNDFNNLQDHLDKQDVLFPSQPNPIEGSHDRVKGIDMVTKVTNYPCPFCLEGFPTASRLANHMMGSHRDRRVDPYKCCKCAKVFKSFVRLQNHELHHKSLLSSICQVCGERFLKASLDSHLQQNHPQDALYTCSLCERTFLALQDLSVHVRECDKEIKKHKVKADASHTGMTLKKNKEEKDLDYKRKLRWRKTCDDIGKEQDGIQSGKPKTILSSAEDLRESRRVYPGRERKRTAPSAEMPVEKLKNDLKQKKNCQDWENHGHGGRKKLRSTSSSHLKVADDVSGDERLLNGTEQMSCEVSSDSVRTSLADGKNPELMTSVSSMRKKATRDVRNGEATPSQSCVERGKSVKKQRILRDVADEERDGSVYSWQENTLPVGGCRQTSEDNGQMRNKKSEERGTTTTLISYSCHVCSKVFHSAVSLTNHNSMAHKVPTRKCRHCDFSCTATVTLTEHILTAHKGIDVGIPDLFKYFCRKCDAVFMNLSRFTKHLQVHAKEKSRTPVARDEKDNLQEGKRQTNITCPVCEKVFKEVKTQNLHLYRHFRNIPGEGKNSVLMAVPHRTETLLTCPKCNQDYASVKYFIEHYHRSHGLNIEVCCMCLAPVESNELLKDHLLDHTTGKRDPVDPSLQQMLGKFFTCKMCFAIFPNKSTFKRHTSCHLKMKDFVCEICGMTFVRRDTLEVHLKSHNNSKVFQCQICGKYLKTVRTLRLHVSIHRGERNFQCKWCLRGFNQMGNLNKHLVRCSLKCSKDLHGNQLRKY